MARKRMVTRNVTSTKVTVMAVDTVKAEIENKTEIISGTYKDDKGIMKYLEKNPQIFGSDYKVVSIVDKQEVEQIYGMLEQDFIRLAKPMDENRKFIESDVEDDTEDDIEDDTEDDIEEA